jgi:betaine reductase
MDLGNQARIKELAEKYDGELLVILGGAEAEGSGLAAETVSHGDPAYAGPLAGVQLGLRVYHILEPVVKNEIDPAVYDEQVSMMEMVLDMDAIVKEVSSIREHFGKAP